MRTRVYPLGQWVAERDGALLGAASAQRLSERFFDETPKRFDLLTDGGRFTASHDGAGAIYHLTGVGVAPAGRGSGIGRLLVDRQVAQARRLPGVRRILGFTRPVGFHRYPQLAIGEYLQLRGPGGLPVDPVLAFHVSGGARIVSAQADYRRADWQSRGYAVLIEYAVVPGESRADG